MKHSKPVRENVMFIIDVKIEPPGSRQYNPGNHTCGMNWTKSVEGYGLLHEIRENVAHRDQNSRKSTNNQCQ